MIVRALRTSPPSRWTSVRRERRSLDPPGDEDLGAEPPRLLEGPAGELVAGDAGGEAKVVLDARRGPGLPARGLALDHDRAQALRRAVHGRGEPRRAGADDDRVVLGRGRLRRQAEQLGDPAVRGTHDGLAVDDADRRESPSGGSGPPHSLAASGASDVSHLNVTWLRSRNWRSSARLGVPRGALPRSPAAGGGFAARPWRPPEPLIRLLASRPTCSATSGLGRREGVVVVRLDPHHARCLGGSEADRERGSEHDRHLAEDVARVSLADHPLDAVDELDRLDPALEHGEQRSLVALRCAANSPGTRSMSAAARETRSRAAVSRVANTRIAPISSAVTIASPRYA